MTRLPRKKQEIFAIDSSDTAGDGTSIYGTPSSGTVQYSKDVDIIQNEKWKLGQASALIGAGIPAMEDHNSLFYVPTRQLKYIFQEGIPEYLATETYYKGSICKTITIDGDKVASQLWFSKVDNNINHSPTEDTENEYWAEFKGSGGGGGFYSGGLFDIVTKDHEVIDDNIKLLGSTINKTNYEKFYNICKDEYEAITNQKLYTFHYIDYADRGDPSNISNYGYKDLSTLGNTKCTFSNGAYFQFMDNLDIPANTTWEFNCKLKYTAEYTSEQMLVSFGNNNYSVLFRVTNRKLNLYASGNGTSWNIASNITSTNQMSINTDYYIKLIYNGSNYRALVSETGEFSGEEIEFIKVEISTAIYNNQADDSKNVWNNLPRSLYSSSPLIEFDMKYYSIKVGDNFVYSNDDWYLVKNSNGHIYYDATKQDIVDMVDEEYTENGVAWYYGINTTNETVKLPRNDYIGNDGRVVGNGKTFGIIDKNNVGYGMMTGSTINSLCASTPSYGKLLTDTYTNASQVSTSNFLGITKDPTKSGVVLNPFGYVYMVVNDNNE